jgi:hypothetical protein
LILITKHLPSGGYTPPPPNDNKLLDRLKPIDDPNATEQSLKNKHFIFDHETCNICEFYSCFGMRESNYKVVQKINAQRPKE